MRLREIGMVHASSGDLDQDFATRRNRLRRLAQDEPVTRTGILDADRFHLTLARPLLRADNSSANGNEAMPIDPDELGPRIKQPEFAMGQDLSAFSAHELEARIAAMEIEIARCRDAIKARQATKNAAAAFFR